MPIPQWEWDEQFLAWLRRVAPETMRTWEETYRRETGAKPQTGAEAQEAGRRAYLEATGPAPAITIFDRPPYKRRLRCVHCGLDGTRHEFGTNRCYSERKGSTSVFSTMNLPLGMTCGDCVHIRRCNAMFGHMPPDETCDWFPIKFQARTTPDTLRDAPTETEAAPLPKVEPEKET